MRTIKKRNKFEENKDNFFIVDFRENQPDTVNCKRNKKVLQTNI